jgi:hypothetical protein
MRPRQDHVRVQKQTVRHNCGAQYANCHEELAVVGEHVHLRGQQSSQQGLNLGLAQDELHGE